MAKGTSVAAKLKAPAKGMTSEELKTRLAGVPGEIVSGEEVANLIFGKSGRSSPYDALLDDLAKATDIAVIAKKERPALKFADARARASVSVRAKKKGLRVTFAEFGGNLYARIEGAVDDDVKGSRRERLLVLLKATPGATTMDLCRWLRERGDGTVDKSTTEAILKQMALAGQVVAAEGETWRVHPTAMRAGGGR